MHALIVLTIAAGWVALLLWGVRMVQTGIQRAYGPKLRQILAQALGNRFKAFCAGAGVTAILQSSTATGLMVTGFEASGLITLTSALAVMLGANVGTTLIVQVMSFDIASLAPLLILVGVIMFRRGGTTRTHDLGRVFIGAGLMLVALQQLLLLTAPYENSPTLRMFIEAVSAQPVIDVLLAAFFAWAAHSSVAVILLVMSLASQGVVTPEAAFAMVLGANLGSAVNPVLEGAQMNDPAAKRVPSGNLVNRGIGIVIALLALPVVTPWLMAIEPNAGRAVADFHTAFNLILAVLFFPFLTPFAQFLKRWLPSKVAQADPAQPLYLDRGACETPVLALGGAAREALRLADVLEDMLEGARGALVAGDRKRIGETRRMDDVLDKLNREIKTYLTSLNPDAMTDADQRRTAAILQFATNMEHAGDLIDKNLMGLAAKRLKRGLTFSAEGEAELISLLDRLISNLRTSAAVFMTEDRRAARLLASEKETFRKLEAEGTASHFDRLRAGKIESAETTGLHLDLLRDIKQINAHLVAAAAYPVLEDQGELLPSRLRKPSVAGKAGK